MEELEKRLTDVLGERYTEITLNEDTRTVTIGVIGLTSDERLKLLAGFVYPSVTLEFVDSQVSRAEVDALYEGVQAWAYKNLGVLQTLSKNYFSGNVHISTADDATLSEAAQGISGEIGRELTLSRSTEENRLSVQGLKAGITFDLQVMTEEESPSENPYRAGKFLAVGSLNGCTTGFLMKKGGLAYGSTAGHCGPDGRLVRFAGIQRGNIQDNTMYGASPAYTDAAIFRMSANGTAYLFQTATSNKVVRSIGNSEVVKVNGASGS
ncbi:hypothetical protein [Arthrobacter sp. CAN_C5]|uniref:hypothetical protein n=1 Tax=Arthrobacter sp. CAN_C5 TaxID=2760706 RepID=UPI001AE38C61|nr:hypothetical protein [Arthrobacter sp. CAN_C5]MBP2216028.1 hypothetical protein [Arthrobacter sp. CAN_C5]